MASYYHPSGIKERFCYCDMCEVDDGRQTYHWEEKDFDLCQECIKKLAQLEVNTDVVIMRARISEEMRNRIYARDGYKCLKCGSKDRLCLDHIKPFVNGGETTEENLQTLCRSCNSKKGAK